MKQAKSGIASQIFSPYHIALTGPPLVIIALFCFGLVLMRQHAVAQLGTTSNSKPASATQPPSGLNFSPVQKLSPLSIGQSDDSSAEPDVTLPSEASPEASKALQSADQKHDSASDSSESGTAISSPDLPTQALLQQHNSLSAPDHQNAPAKNY